MTHTWRARSVGPIAVFVCLGFYPAPAAAQAQDPAPTGQQAGPPQTEAPPQQQPQPAQQPPPGQETSPDPQTPPPAEQVQLREASELPGTGFKALFRDTAYDFKHFVSDKEPVLSVLIGGVAAFAAHPIDDNVNKRLSGKGGVHAFFKPGKVVGYGAVQIGAAIGTWAVGRMTDKRGRAAHMGLDLLRAQIVTQTFTYGLKYAVRRERPDGTGFSFPSGHASTTFASASVLQRHFGWRAGVPTYALAAYVAASRLHENRHFLSDVIFGGAIGYAAGRAVTRHGRSTFTMVPLVVPHGYGLAMVRTG